MLDLQVTKTKKGSLLFVDPDGDKHYANNAAEAWSLLNDLVTQEPDEVSALARVEVIEVDATPVVHRQQVQTISADEPEEDSAPLEFDVEEAAAKGISNLVASAIIQAKKMGGARGRGRRCRRRTE